MEKRQVGQKGQKLASASLGNPTFLLFIYSEDFAAFPFDIIAVVILNDL